jgi:putative ABC transport system permease protein
MVYLPPPKVEGGSFFVRARAGTPSLAGIIRADVAAVDRIAQVENIRPLKTAVDNMVSQERLTATLCPVFSALAMLLAAVGLYGVVAYSVSRRTNEFGVRMALGAQRGDVQRLVLRQTAMLVLAGVSAGLATALVLSRILSATIAGMLYVVDPGDGPIFAGAAALLSAIALLAAFLPARRASRIDPMIALRYE